MFRNIKDILLMIFAKIDLIRKIKINLKANNKLVRILVVLNPK